MKYLFLNDSKAENLLTQDSVNILLFDIAPITAFGEGLSCKVSVMKQVYWGMDLKASSCFKDHMQRSEQSLFFKNRKTLYLKHFQYMSSETRVTQYTKWQFALTLP